MGKIEANFGQKQNLASSKRFDLVLVINPGACIELAFRVMWHVSVSCSRKIKKLKY